MSRVRTLLAATVVPERSVPQVIRGALTGVGVFTFLFGVLGLQFLAPTRVEMVLVLLLLATFAVASAALGQVVVIAALIERRAEADAPNG